MNLKIKTALSLSLSLMGLNSCNVGTEICTLDDTCEEPCSASEASHTSYNKEFVAEQNLEPKFYSLSTSQLSGDYYLVRPNYSCTQNGLQRESYVKKLSLSNSSFVLTGNLCENTQTVSNDLSDIQITVDSKYIKYRGSIYELSESEIHEPTVLSTLMECVDEELQSQVTIFKGKHTHWAHVLDLREGENVIQVKKEIYEGNYEEPYDHGSCGNRGVPAIMPIYTYISFKNDREGFYFDFDGFSESYSNYLSSQNPNITKALKCEAFYSN